MLPALPCYRLARTLDGRPTKAEVEKERCRRIRELGRVAHRGLWGEWCRRLAKALADDLVQLKTMANPVFVWEMQDLLIGNIHLLLDQEDRKRVATFTINKRAWAKHAVELLRVPELGTHGVDLKRSVKQEFRKNLNDALKKLREAGKVVRGWLICVIEVAYDEPTGCYQIHIHGIATDDYIDVVDGLRRFRSFKPWKKDGRLRIPGCRRPVVIKERLTDLPRPFAYMLKMFWKLRRAGKRVRLPGDEHIRSLLVLNQYRVDDLVLMMGVQVKDGRLKAISR